MSKILFILGTSNFWAPLESFSSVFEDKTLIFGDSLSYGYYKILAIN